MGTNLLLQPLDHYQVYRRHVAYNDTIVMCCIYRCKCQDTLSTSIASLHQLSFSPPFVPSSLSSHPSTPHKSAPPVSPDPNPQIPTTPAKGEPAPLTQNHTNISTNPHVNTTLLHSIPPKKLPSFPNPTLAPPSSLNAPPAGFHK